MITFSYCNTANYLSSDTLIDFDKKSHLGIKPGDKITKLGTKRRSSFEVIEGHYLEYCGLYRFDEIDHMVFTSFSEPLQWRDQYWYYAFAIIPDSNRLYLQSSENSGFDICVDNIFYYEQ